MRSERFKKHRNVKQGAKATRHQGENGTRVIPEADMQSPATTPTLKDATRNVVAQAAEMPHTSTAKGPIVRHLANHLESHCRWRGAGSCCFSLPRLAACCCTNFANLLSDRQTSCIAAFNSSASSSSLASRRTLLSQVTHRQTLPPSHRQTSSINPSRLRCARLIVHPCTATDA
jgi:hypothetical protein